jgi:hypothetical protein
MTSDQDTGRPANDGPRESAPAPADNTPANPTASDRAAAAGATAGPSTAPRVAILLSLLSLVVAITGPLWSPTIYGSPDSARFMVLGVAQLRPVLASNEPFRNELTLVREVMPSQPDVDQALDMLAAYADKGVPTVPELQASFVKLANAIVLNDVVGTAPSRFDRAIISAAAALHLHALAEWLNDTRPASAIVWETKAHLDTGDLPGAAAALGKLTGREAIVARPWLSAVQSRIAADEVLEFLETVAHSRVAMMAQRS